MIRVVALLCGLLLGCQSEIGDPCASNADCSSKEARLCDTTYPGGYCTVFNCEPGGCSEEASCIGFRSTLSPAPACEDPTQTRLQQAFCMRRCSAERDCRGGYACTRVGADDPWGAVVLESGRETTRVCLPDSTEPPPLTSSDGVCSSVGAAPLPDGAVLAVAPVEPGTSDAGRDVRLLDSGGVDASP